MVTLAVTLVFRVCVLLWRNITQTRCNADISSPRRTTAPSDLRRIKVTGHRLSPGRRFSVVLNLRIAKRLPSRYDNGLKRKRPAVLLASHFASRMANGDHHAYSSPGFMQHVRCADFAAAPALHAIVRGGRCGHGGGLARVFRTRCRQRKNGSDRWRRGRCVSSRAGAGRARFSRKRV